jgi:CRISPR-associated protein Cas1
MRAIPPPLVDSPKCPGCSLVGICLPDETFARRCGTAEEPQQLGLFGTPRQAGEARGPGAGDAAQRIASAVSQQQGVRVGKSGAVLQVKDKEKVVQEVRIGEICQVSLMGNVQISTQAVQALCEAACRSATSRWAAGSTASRPG